MPWPLVTTFLLLVPCGAGPVLGPRTRNGASLVNSAKLPLHTKGGRWLFLGGDWTTKFWCKFGGILEQSDDFGRNKRDSAGIEQRTSGPLDHSLTFLPTRSFLHFWVSKESGFHQEDLKWKTYQEMKRMVWQLKLSQKHVENCRKGTMRFSKFETCISVGRFQSCCSTSLALSSAGRYIVNVENERVRPQSEMETANRWDGDSFFRSDSEKSFGFFWGEVGVHQLGRRLLLACGGGGAGSSEPEQSGDPNQQLGLQLRSLVLQHSTLAEKETVGFFGKLWRNLFAVRVTG